MSGYSFVGSSGGAAAAPVNPNTTVEDIGFVADGTLASVTASATINTKGAYVTLGTTANAWSGFDLEIGDGSSAAARFLLDLRIGGATVILPDFLLAPGSANSASRVSVPLVIPTGTLIEARCQAHVASAILRIALSGRITNSNSPPMFTTCTALNIDAATTNPTATAIPLAATLGSYTQIIAATASSYGAMIAVGINNGTPITAQQVTFIIAQGAAAAEIALRRFAGRQFVSTQPYHPRAYRLIEQSVASGSRLSAAALAATPGTESVRCALYGFA